MKTGLVTFSFCGNVHSKRKYVIKTDLPNLERGDMLYIQGVKEGEKYIVCFFRYVENDYLPDLERISVIGRVPVNVLEELAEGQLEKFKQLHVMEKACRHYRNKFRDNVGFTNEQVKKKILRNLCVASKLQMKHKHGRFKGCDFYLFGRMMIVVKNNSTVIYIKRMSYLGKNWARPELTAVIDRMLFSNEYFGEKNECRKLVNL